MENKKEIEIIKKMYYKAKNATELELHYDHSHKVFLSWWRILPWYKKIAYKIQWLFVKG